MMKYASLQQKFGVADPDPGFGSFLTPGYVIRDEKKSRSEIQDKHPRSHFRELGDNFMV
jgi:hypothetical protein